MWLEYDKIHYSFAEAWSLRYNLLASILFKSAHTTVHEKFYLPTFNQFKTELFLQGQIRKCCIEEK